MIRQKTIVSYTSMVYGDCLVCLATFLTSLVQLSTYLAQPAPNSSTAVCVLLLYCTYLIHHISRQLPNNLPMFSGLSRPWCNALAQCNGCRNAKWLSDIVSDCNLKNMIAALLKSSVILLFVHLHLWVYRISDSTGLAKLSTCVWYVCRACLLQMIFPHELRVWYLQRWQLREASTSPLSCCCSWLFFSSALATSEPTVQTEAIFALSTVRRPASLTKIQNLCSRHLFSCINLQLQTFTRCDCKTLNQASPAFQTCEFKRAIGILQALPIWYICMFSKALAHKIEHMFSTPSICKFTCLSKDMLWVTEMSSIQLLWSI